MFDDFPVTPIIPSNDSNIPVIIEFPSSFPWQNGEQENWRAATPEEYQTYLDYYNSVED